MSEPSTSSLANFIWGEARLQRRCELLRVLTVNPVFSKSNLYSMSRRDIWAVRAQQSKELIELRLKLGWTRQHFLDAVRLIGETVPAYPQYRIFMNNLLAQMSPEQQAYWVPKADRFEIFGCYAQTELGHGSNLHGIETTAKFDKGTDEFVLNSPTISSTKFWSGTLGCWATHAIVVARLIVEEKDLGNHLFLVQVRDLDTQDLLPGVSIYEHGEKTMGSLAGVDNGAMRFYGCRIPRSVMFAGAASLSRDGVYTAAKDRNHSFMSMVIIRGLLSDELGLDMAKALYIAAKYAGFRRQFGATEGGQETRVIDYGSVQYRLYPAIARAVTLMVIGREIAEKVKNRQALKENLQALHLETVGCKVYASEHAVRAADLARLVCGGHGTLASAGLGNLYAALSPSRTYEGDSYVISLQIGRAVVKHWKAGTYGSIPALSYLEHLSKIKTSDIKLTTTGPESWFKADLQHHFIERRAALLAKRHLDDTARNRDTSFDVLELTMAHSDLVYWKALNAQFPRVAEENKEIMQAVMQLFSLTTMVEGLNTFAGHSFLVADDVKNLRLAQEQAITIFGLHVDTILDAYSFTDYEANSTLCKSDRTPYEAIMDVVRTSPLNDSHFIRPTMISARQLWKKYPSPSL